MSGYNLKRILYSCLKIFFTSTNSEDPDDSDKIFFTSTNSEGPDEMQHYVAFHLGLHCLPRYLFRGFRSLNG